MWCKDYLKKRYSKKINNKILHPTMVEQHQETENTPFFNIKDFIEKYPSQQSLDKLDKEFF